MAYYKHMGFERKQNNTNTTSWFGCMEVENCKSFYIKVAGWLHIQSEQENGPILNEWMKQMRYYIRARALKLHPDSLYSFVHVELHPSFVKYSKTKKGYFQIECTVLLKEPHIGFTKDLELQDRLIEFQQEIQVKLMSFDSLEVTRHKTIELSLQS